jgi:predicted transcriptional regulator
MIDRSRIRERHRELSYVTGRFMTEHLIRVHKLFEGDLTAAIVLATVAQHNVQRYYDEVGRDAPEGFDPLVAANQHLPHLRPCNALSVSAATGVPRETVRRKVRWLEQKGWLSIGERGQLSVVNGISKDFQDFDIETTERLLECLQAITRVLEAPAVAKRRGD